MRGVQLEAHQIESEMEQRFHGLIARKEGTMRSMPASLTQEMEDARNQLEQAVDSAPSFNKTRDLIIQRLGGPFDYNQYAEDLR